MKKAFSIFSILLLVSLFCVSCGNSEKKPVRPEEPADTEVADTDTDTGDTDTGEPASNCGNKIIDEGEICDGGATECGEVIPGYVGYATCKEDCSGWDTAGCLEGEVEEPDDDTTDTDDPDTDDPAEPEDVTEIGEPLGEVTAYDDPEGFDGIFYDGPGEDEAFIFYPGANIEPEAYYSLMTMLAERGVDCFVIKMPMNMAVLGKDKADDIYNNYPNYKKYYLGGHSLGGSMVASYAAKHLDRTHGLFFFAAFPTDNMMNAQFPILFIYGSNDKVLNKSMMENSYAKVPAEYTHIYEIAGGNHASFGDYGKQTGDGEATIEAIVQQKITVHEILKLIR